MPQHCTPRSIQDSAERLSDKTTFAKIRTAISKIPTFVQTTNERKSLESTNDLFIQCSRSMTNFGSFEMFPVSQNIFNNIVEPLIYDPYGTGSQKIQKIQIIRGAAIKYVLSKPLSSDCVKRLHVVCHDCNPCTPATEYAHGKLHAEKATNIDRDIRHLVCCKRDPSAKWQELHCTLFSS